jgi:hypothetical protein
LIALGPQIILGAIVVAIWNPIRISTGDPSSAHGWLIDRFILLWRTLRDADRCEYGPSLVFLLAIPVAIWKRNPILIRMLVALLIAFVAIDFASPQSPRSVETADVRYFSSLIPLLIAIGVLTLRLAFKRLWYAALILAPVAFCTNLLNPVVFQVGARVTVAKFIHELWSPPPDPYSAAVQWIDANIHSGESIASLPGYYAYPLMFHAPQAVYGWQLEPDQKPQFPGLAGIYFVGQDAPDCIIAFGPVVADLIRGYRPPPGVAYSSPIILDVFCKDMYRPELMWRTFDPIAADKEHGTAIYIFKKQSAAPIILPEPSAPTPLAGPSSDFKL